jgi:hypothetical protein
MKNRTTLEHWRMFRRINHSLDNARRQMRIAQSKEEIEAAYRRSNCLTHLQGRVMEAINKSFQ